MKRLILMLALMLTMLSCKAQEVDSLKRGYAIGLVIDSTSTGVIVNSDGRSLIVDGILENGTEYDLVYDIIQRRPDGVLIVKLVAAEYSARQNAKDRAKLLSLLKK